MSQELNGISPPKSFRGTPVIILILGVIIPVIAISVELIFHFCAEAFFNPIPSIWHGLLIISVPIFNFVCWLQCYSRRLNKYHTLMIWLNAVTIGISAYYSLLFLPVMLIGLLLIAIMGIGLLPLSPLFALTSGIFLKHKLNKLAITHDIKPVPKSWKGITVALIILILLDAPVAATRIGLSLAGSESAFTNRQGVSFLRILGNREQMLRSCYERPVFTTNIINSLCNLIGPINPLDARKIYYQVTGTTFNSVPPPRLTGRGALDNTEEWFFDEDQGGQTVAAVIKGLSLSGSRMDTSIDPDAALSYTEWTLTFTNKTHLQHEARTQIMLPPGGFVSRLTLWVHGEEREAAFAKRSNVINAYQKVVRSQRDPVLVTDAGPDRILLQCYPVPPDGGTMKVRLGITAPLILESKGSRGSLYLPAFTERNFIVPKEVNHSIWAESRHGLTSNSKDLTLTANQDNSFSLRGAIAEQSLRERTLIITERNPLISLSLTPDPFSNQFVLQRIVPIKQPIFKRFIVVIDGSAALREFQPQFNAILPAIPPDVQLRLIVAGDRLREKTFSPGLHRTDEVRSWVKGIRFQGGNDNLPALSRAYDLAVKDKGCNLLWIHGPQPVLLSSPDALQQRFDRKPGVVRINDYQPFPGPNLISENFGNYITAVNYSGNPKHDLIRYLENLAGKRTEFGFIREKTSNINSGPQTSIRTSSHLARLWAYDQVLKLIDSGRPNDFKDAASLAATYQIVTPVSGAVVLESQAQYNEAGLKPVDPDAVPTVPEPDLWILSVFGSLLLWVGFKMKKSMRRKLCS